MNKLWSQYRQEPKGVIVQNPDTPSSPKSPMHNLKTNPLEDEYDFLSKPSSSKALLTHKK